MRILRLRVANFRGIEARTIEFARTGITVIEGPNESGKTSLLHALDLVFEYPAESKHTDVLASKPIGQDVSTEIEVDAVAGPYEFRLMKRFHAKRVTELHVRLPAVEEHTSREAHDRLRQILATSVDLLLWRALRIVQGAALEIPELALKPSLSEALNRAAGGAAAGAREKSLLDAVEEEYQRYFTQTGQPRKDSVELAAAVTGLQGEIDSTAAALAKFDADVDRAEELAAAITSLQVKAAEAQDTERKHKETREKVSRLESDAKLLRSKSNSAQAAFKEAERHVKERALLVQAALDARAKARTLADDLAASEPAFHALEKEAIEAEAQRTKAEEALARAEAAHVAAKRDLEEARDLVDCGILEQRWRTVETADRDAATAHQTIESNKVTDAKRKTLEEANKAVVEARAKLEVGSPKARIVAHRSLHPVIDGEVHLLQEAEEREFPILQSMRISVPDVADVEVVPGADTRGLREEFEKAEKVLKGLLEELGVENLDHAIRENAALADAKRTVKNHDRIVGEALGDLSREKLEHKLTSVRTRVEAAKARRGPDSPPLPMFDETQGCLLDAEQDLKTAKADLIVASGRSDSNRTRLSEAKVKAAESRTKAHSVSVEADLAEDRVTSARSGVSDAELERRAVDLATVAEVATRAAETAERDLASADPEHVELLLRNAHAASERMKTELRRLQDEELKVKTLLTDHGEDGLSEQFDAKSTDLERAAGDLRRHEGKMAAAKLLRDVMREERDKAQRAYVAPLRGRIESLGRHIFGPTLQVEMDDDLRTVSRTLNGLRVPYESLSGGTREQLGIITRLACAMAVAQDGGVPVILDDALGYSDPRRLEEMGAVLSVAARDCQIVLLTCMPDRYRHIGEATIVALP